MSQATNKPNLLRNIRRLRATADHIEGVDGCTGIPAVLREIATNFSERFDVEEASFAQARRAAEFRNRMAEETKNITPSNLAPPQWLKDIGPLDIDVEGLLS